MCVPTSNQVTAQAPGTFSFYPFPCSLAPLTFIFLSIQGSRCRPPKALLTLCLCYPTCISRAQRRITPATWKAQVERKSWLVSLLLLNFNNINSVMNYCKVLCCSICSTEDMGLSGQLVLFFPSTCKPNFFKIGNNQWVTLTQKSIPGSENPEYRHWSTKRYVCLAQYMHCPLLLTSD